MHNVIEGKGGFKETFSDEGNVKQLIYLTFFGVFNLFIFSLVLKTYTLFFTSLGILFLLYIYFYSISLRKFIIEKKENEKREKEENHKKFKEKIENIYFQNFKNSKFKDIFNEKIFVMIDLLIDLIQNNLKGIARERILETVNTSLRFYIINLESASKMLKAEESADLNFEKEITDLLNKNNLIIERLKEFISNLILMNVSDREFSDLVSEFEKSSLNIKNIKEFREGL